MNQTAWLQLAADKTLQTRIAEDPVVAVYGAVVSQFSSWNPIRWADAVVALHVAYGWMPTIPNLGLPAKLDSDQRTLVESLFNAARLRLLTLDELAFLKLCFANNSIVGLSKMLHLLAPYRYAIWDRRVAIAWHAPAKPRFYGSNDCLTPAGYLRYLEELHRWDPTPRAQAVLAIRRLSPDLSNVTELRILELVLFHYRRP
jgi:hypothetical protein